MFGLRLRGQWPVPIILGMASQVLLVMFGTMMYYLLREMKHD